MKDKTSERWSPREEKTLIDMVNQGFTYKEITERLVNRPYKGVTSKARQLGLQAKHCRNAYRYRGFWTDEKLSELRSMCDQGLSSGIIARRLGTTRNAILGKIWREDIPRHNIVETTRHNFRPRQHLPRIRKDTVWTEDNKNELRKLVSQGLDAKQISARLSFYASPSAVRHRVRREGLSIASRPRRKLFVHTGEHPFYMPKVDFLNRTDKQCGYPLWGPEDKTGDVCGCSKSYGQPYCSHHMTRAYIPGSAGRRRTWDKQTREFARNGGIHKPH